MLPATQYREIVPDELQPPTGLMPGSIPFLKIQKNQTLLKFFNIFLKGKKYFQK